MALCSVVDFMAFVCVNIRCPGSLTASLCAEDGVQ